MMPFPFAFLEFPFSLPSFVRIPLAILACAAALLCGVLICVVLIKKLSRRQRQVMAVHKWLRLENQGNSVGVFQLHSPKAVAASDTGEIKIKFSLLHEGKPLGFAVLPPPPPPPVIQSPSPAPSANAPVAPLTPAASSPVLQPPSSSPPSSSTQSGSSSSAAGNAKKSALGAVGFGRTLGGIAGALGGLLPGSVGRSLKEQSTRMQDMTQQATRTIEAPEQQKRELENIQAEIGSLSGKEKDKPGSQPARVSRSNTQTQSGSSTTQSGSATMQSGSPITQSGSSKANAHPAPPSSVPRPPSSAPRPASIISKDTFQTPPIPPGESLRLQLVLSPANLYRNASFSVSIQSSQMVESPQAGLQSVNTSEIKQAVVFNGLPRSRAILNTLLAVLIVVINISWVSWLISWLIGSYI